MSVTVSGIGIISALGIGVETTMHGLRAQRKALAPARHFATTHTMPVAEVAASDCELKLQLGIDPRQVISRTTLLGMVAASEAIADAGIKNNLEKVAFISATTVGGMGLTQHFYTEFLQNPNRGRLRYVAQHDCADSTKRIAAYCGIGGFSTTISTACSSAANAIMLGARMIELGMVDTVIAGGSDALCQFTLNGFKSLMILDNDECRPFDASRSGLNLGEGAAYLVLQRSNSAINGYCQLSGYANANDAFHQTASSAEGNGAFKAMTQAIAKASLCKEQISYINVHGTGTPNNDATEGAAMQRIWGNNVPPFSSTKVFTGHTLAAAGAVEAVLAVLSVKNGCIFPHLNFNQPIDGLECLVPQTEFADGKNIDAVLSNSFGFGGNCTSLLFTSNSCKTNETKQKTAALPCYINAIARYDKDIDLKQIVPDANMRRRMSQIVKMGVATGICAANKIGQKPDAIITATGLGCLTDSEKFLKNIIDNKEQMLNPTPFIQSTFNTIGGQIAILTNNDGYNMTYSHRLESFESALADSMMKINEGAKNVLLGVIDEITPTQTAIMRRMGVWRNGDIPQPDALFFVLSKHQTDDTIASLEFETEENSADASDTILTDHQFYTSSAQALLHGVEVINGCKCVRVCFEKLNVVLKWPH